MIEFTSTKSMKDHQTVGSRGIVGQAEGILMERFAIGTGQAYAYLRGDADSSGREVAVVALELVRTRVSPRGCPEAA